jgi:hypothetical protein
MNPSKNEFEVGGWLVWCKVSDDDYSIYKIVKVNDTQIYIEYENEWYPYAIPEINAVNSIAYIGPNEDFEKQLLFWRLKYG